MVLFYYFKVCTLQHLMDIEVMGCGHAKPTILLNDLCKGHDGLFIKIQTLLTPVEADMP